MRMDTAFAACCHTEVAHQRAQGEPKYGDTTDTLRINALVVEAAGVQAPSENSGLAGLPLAITPRGLGSLRER